MNIVKHRLFVLFVGLSPALLAAAEVKLTPAQLDNAKLTITTVTTRAINPQLRVTGTLMADQRKTHRVAPVVDGVVTELRTIAHEHVRKGHILARLHSPTLGQTQAGYLEALARFDLAQSERARIEGLWKDGVVAENRWLQVDSEFKSARATLDARRRSLSLAGLTAEQIKELPNNPDRLATFDLVSPINGQVTAIEIESGQLLTAGQTAFQVADFSTLWAMVKIPVANLPQVSDARNRERLLVLVEWRPSCVGRLQSAHTPFRPAREVGANNSNDSICSRCNRHEPHETIHFR